MHMVTINRTCTLACTKEPALYPHHVSQHDTMPVHSTHACVHITTPLLLLTIIKTRELIIYGVREPIWQGHGHGGKAVHSQNTPFPSSWSPFGRVAEVRLLHPSNA